MDPLLERITQLTKNQSDLNRKKAKEDAGMLHSRVKEHANVFGRFFDQIMRIVKYIIDVFCLPVIRFAYNPAKRFILWNWRLFKKYGFNENEHGYKTLSPYKMSIFLVSYVTCWMMFAFTIDMTYYTSLFFLTRNHEVIFMTNSQEVNSDEDIFSAQGCEALPCTIDNSVYFRIEPVWFNHFYSYFTEGHLFYSDYVAAAVPPTVTQCTIYSYGIRWKLLMRGMDIYPYLLSATCTPVIDEQK